MDPAEFYYLGKIVKRHGNRGHLLALLDVDDAGNYRNLESVYVDIAHERIPFFIETLEILDGKRVLLKFRDVESADHADAFTGLELFLPLSRLPQLDGTRFYFHEVTGFQVIDESEGVVGEITGVLELPHQALFQIERLGKEILVPVVDEVIRRIDRQARTIYISAPEGLIGLYTG